MFRKVRLALFAFARARKGNVALIAAIATPALIGASALTIDFANAITIKDSLQSAADSAALAAARELPLRSTSQATVSAISAEYVRRNVDPRIQVTSLSSAILDNRGGVRVEVHARANSVMGNFINANGLQTNVTAVARLSGGAPLCALALEERAQNAIQLQQDARLVAPDCAVVSNSTSPRGVVASGNSRMQATMICSAGGASGRSSNFDPAAITDCPRIDDPLAGRPEPASGGCDHLLALSVTGNRQLEPGVYCGGITILPGARATLAPGIYVIKNGPLAVLGGASLVGQNVGFYFVGDLSVMNFAQGSEIDLSAPRDGPMAGFLFFANRVLLTGALNLRHFRINSDNARNLLGTIYLRDGVLDVDANRPIADRSSYTVIVARRINVSSGPDLVLNTDYEGSTVPVPEGVGPRRPEAYLAQ